MDYKVYPIIDGDGLLYRCGFAAQHRVYDHDGLKFRYKADLTRHLVKNNKSLEDFTYAIEAEPVENALSNVKQVMQSVLKLLDADEYKVVISSNTPTFRDKLARIKPYKGNRKDNDKPIHYEACREYLIDMWNAEPCFGIEADDACGIHQTKYDTSVIVSNDKDLLQIPGMHLNWTKEDPKVSYVNPEEALYNKYIQVLSGDATDNIEGIPGLGDAGAAKMLLHMFGAEEEEYDDVCRSIYDEYFTSDKDIKSMKMSYVDYASNILHMRTEEIYEETKALITILTKEPDFDTREAS